MRGWGKLHKVSDVCPFGPCSSEVAPQWDYDGRSSMQETTHAAQTQGSVVGCWKLRVLNSSCVPVSEDHSKSECQHHSSSSVSFHESNTVPVSRIDTHQAAAAQPRGPMMTPQAEVPELFEVLGPPHA